MCGIAGYFGKFDLNHFKIKKALDILKERGPDFRNYSKYRKKDIFIKLIHTRLAIIDLDKRSNQPMENENFSLVFNGEIYNYIELKKDLENKGLKFKTTSDSEVILNGYTYYSDKIFELMEGMWALSIYDKKNNKIILSRDRFSEKPLFYYSDANEFIFSSDIKVIRLFCKKKFSVNHKRLLSGVICGYKSLNKDPSQTMYENIKSLEGSTILKIKKNFSIQKIYFWKPNTYINKKLKKKEIFVNAKKKLLHSIKLRLRADVESAFCLSGGIDSGSIASIAAKEFNQKINSFSIIDDNDMRYNEKSNIDLVVKDLNSNHNEIYISEIKNNLDHLKSLINYKSSPICTITYYLHSFLIKNISQNNYKVCFSGTAADEIFTGYYDHQLQFLNDIKSSKIFKKNLNNFNKYLLPNIRNENFKNPYLYINNPKFRKHIFDNVVENTTFLKNKINKNDFIFTEKKFSKNLSLNRRMNELFHENIPTILYEEDTNSMMYSVENRSPYLDSNLVNFMNSIETRHLIYNGFTKNILRNISKRYLHRKVRLDRSKKGFNSSVTSIFDVFGDDIKDLILNKKNKVYNFFDFKKIVEIYDTKDLNINHYSKLLFSLINLILFYEDKELT